MKKGFTIWLTGHSGAGKTTIAGELKNELSLRGIDWEILDGDIIRENLSKGLSFSRKDRDINVLRIGFVAELLTRHGVCVIVSAISPYRETREMVRNKIGNFVEVFVKCSIEECEKRDVKGLYKMARAGEIKGFTGIDDPYELPLKPEVTCNTEVESIEESVRRIICTLENLKYISSIKDDSILKDQEELLEGMDKGGLISK